VVAWWERHLEAARLAPTVLPLRLKRRPAEVGDGEGRLGWGLTPAASMSLDGLAGAVGATFYMLRLAGVLPVLAALTRRDDALVGGIFTMRNRLAYEDMFGPVANIVAIGMRMDWAWPFREFAGRVRDHVGALQQNADVPPGLLADELAARGIALPAPMVMVHVHTATPPLTFAGLRLSASSARVAMQRGITIGFNQFREVEACYVVFDERLYDRDTMAVLAAALARFLDEAGRDPDAALGVLVERSRIEPVDGRPAPITRLAGSPGRRGTRDETGTA
jgi:hypothetical protein